MPDDGISRKKNRNTRIAIENGSAVIRTGLPHI